MQTASPELVLPSQALNVAFTLPDAITETTVESEDNALATGVIYGLPIADFGLLIDIDSGSQILDACDITMLPHTQPWLLGMASWNGLIAPVFDLHKLLGVDKPEAAHVRYLMLGKGSSVVGFTIYCTPRLVHFNHLEVSDYPPLPDKLRHSVSQCFKEDIYWLTWDFEAFFSDVQVSL